MAQFTRPGPSDTPQPWMYVLALVAWIVIIGTGILCNM